MTTGKPHGRVAPFHRKTPSFHADDEGSIIAGWVPVVMPYPLREQDGQFMEAIHHLAGLAGLTVPEQKDISPEEKAQQYDGFHNEEPQFS